MGYWGYGGGPFHWFGFGFGMITHVLFLVLLIYGIIWLFRSRPGLRRESSALEILKCRYAKGEISSEDYQRMKKELE